MKVRPSVPKAQMQNVAERKAKEVLGKAKGIDGSDDYFFSANLDLSQ